MTQSAPWNLNPPPMTLHGSSHFALESFSKEGGGERAREPGARSSRAQGPAPRRSRPTWGALSVGQAGDGAAPPALELRRWSSMLVLGGKWPRWVSLLGFGMQKVVPGSLEVPGTP